MCEWVLEGGEYFKSVLSHFPKVPGVFGDHLGGAEAKLMQVNES